LYHKLPR